ncbi:unnamed protein product, partial [Mesorhabditis spiculigera]
MVLLYKIQAYLQFRQIPPQKLDQMCSSGYVLKIFSICRSQTLFCRRHSCYQLSWDLLDYTEAQAACKNSDGELAYVPDEATNLFLASSFGKHITGRVWIGIEYDHEMKMWTRHNGLRAQWVNPYSEIAERASKGAYTLLGNGNWKEESKDEKHARICEYPYSNAATHEHIRQDALMNVTLEMEGHMNRTGEKRDQVMKLIETFNVTMTRLYTTTDELWDNFTDIKEDLDLVVRNFVALRQLTEQAFSSESEAHKDVEAELQRKIDDTTSDITALMDDLQRKMTLLWYLLFFCFVGIAIFVAWRKGWFLELYSRGKEKYNRIRSRPSATSQSTGQANNSVSNQCYEEA